MRYSPLAAIGLAGLLVIGGLRLGGGQADAQQTPESGPHTFAEYAGNALKVDDVVVLNRDNVGGGYSVTLLPKESVEWTQRDKMGDTVKEIHSDYVVFRKKARQNSFEKPIIETVVPFHAITTFNKYLDNDSE